MSIDARSSNALKAPQPNTVLYVIDVSSDFDTAVVSARELADEHGAEVEVIHVIDPARAPSRPDVAMGIQYGLEKLGRRLNTIQRRAKSLLLFGAAEEVIPKRARDLGAKLIAFARDDSSTADGQQLLIRSITRQVTCPVITLAAKES